MSFLGLGASSDDNNKHQHQHQDDDSSASVIHQDSDSDDDEDAIHDDDVDIGFRRHQYETFHDDDDDDDNNKNNSSRKRRQSRQEAKEEALYGVFYEGETRTTTRKRSRTTEGTPGGAPMFVPASKQEDTPISNPTTTNDTSSAPVVTASASAATTAVTATVDTVQETLEDVSSKQSPPPQTQEEAIEEKNVEEKQKSADAYFHSLLQLAQDKRRRREPPVDNSTTATSWEMNGISSSSLPKEFGKDTRMQTPPLPTLFSGPAIKKDPAIAKWEKHEKGIGSKLLFKMGWKGSGGLGSNRRKLLSSTTSTTTTTATTAGDAVPGITQDSSLANTSASAEGAEIRAKTGISRPVEVVVRPTNLGLGFGNFKEQSQLKSNRQIEAEVRGIELAKTKKKKGVLDILEGRGHGDDNGDYDDDEDDLGPSTSSAFSSIPTTQELMKQKPWKRRKVKRPAPKIIHYTELVAQHERHNSASLGQPVIIDMRGPSSSTTGTGGALTVKDAGKVPLGEELLHNVTFMLNTHENQLHSYSQIIKSTERKEESLISEITDLKRQQQEARDRRKKLESTLLLVGKVEDLAKQPTDDGRKDLDQVIQWVQELGDSFTSEDRGVLKFWQGLAPAVLSPILHGRLARWDPLGPIERTKEFLDSLFHIKLDDRKGNMSLEDQVALKELRYSIFQGQLLPRVKQVLESSRWDPSRQTEAVLDMYEYLQLLATKSKPAQSDDVGYAEYQILSGGPPDSDHSETSPFDDLAEVFRKELVLDTIYTKLQTTLGHWKPSLPRGSKFGLEQRLDLWILPWMLHLDHPAILPNLLAECKRKLANSLSYLQRRVGKDDDLEFVRVATDTLKPWARVYDQIALQRLVSESITPYLGRALAKQTIHQRASEQDWTAVHLTFELHACGILSDIEFSSVLEAELLPRWAAKLNEMLVGNEISVSQAATNYCLWKGEVLVNPRSMSTSPIRAMKLLQDDLRICEIFYTVLRMIQLKRQSNDNLEDLDLPSTNYHVVSARRTKERQSQVQDDFVRIESRSTTEVEARLRLRRRQVDTPSFREVVEEFANERGILFQPRMGGKALKDGKQVFLFGDIPIYIEGDVVYASRIASNWRPTSLDQLVQLSEGNQ